MSFGKQATSDAFIKKLIKLLKILPEDQSILELGSGHTSQIILDNKGAHEYQALEDSQYWYEDIRKKSIELRPYITYAPLVPNGLSSSEFYDISKIKVSNVGLLLIDGPPGGRRWPGSLLCWKFLAKSYVIIADDMFREQYKHGMELWSYGDCKTLEERFRNLTYHGEGPGMFAVFKGNKK